jgi:hypothetical protein
VSDCVENFNATNKRNANHESEKQRDKQTKLIPSLPVNPPNLALAAFPKATQATPVVWKERQSHITNVLIAGTR